MSTIFSCKLEVFRYILSNIIKLSIFSDFLDKKSLDFQGFQRYFHQMFWSLLSSYIFLSEILVSSAISLLSSGYIARPEEKVISA